MNGSMFGELRELLKEKGDLSQDAVNRLTLSALAEISTQFSIHIQVAEKRDEGVLNLKDSVDDLSTAVTLLSQSVIDLKKEITTLQSDVVTLKSNPFVALGKYIKDKPKQSIAWGLGVFAIFYLFFGLKLVSLIIVLIGSLLGMPQESIDWLLNWLSQ